MNAPNTAQKDCLQSSIFFYIMIQVILAFWLVFANDLLEDRCTIDVIITKFFPLPFNILRDWAKDKVQKSLAEALNRFEKLENKR